jgi:predicted SAM-dependent methyltransferase
MKKIKLHIGCGKRDLGDEWIGIDGATYPHVQYHDITKLDFENNSVTEIYASHVLEYFNRDEAVDVLKEWYRVLKPGGILRVAVPDFGIMAGMYIGRNLSLDNFIGPLYGKMPMDDITIYHKTAYDYKSLKDILLSVGFPMVTRYKWQDLEIFKDPNYDDQSRAYIPHMDFENGILISLNLEAVK